MDLKKKEGRKKKKGRRRKKHSNPDGQSQEGGGVVDAPRAARRCWHEGVLHVTRQLRALGAEHLRGQARYGLLACHVCRRGAGSLVMVKRQGQNRIPFDCVSGSSAGMCNPGRALSASAGSA